MEEEEKRWQQLHYIPNWFSVDVKTGVGVTTYTKLYPSWYKLQMLMIRLEESEYGTAWVLGDKSGLANADGDIKGLTYIRAKTNILNIRIRLRICS